MRPVYEAVARVYAWALFVGYSSIPISILIFGLGKNTIK